MQKRRRGDGREGKGGEESLREGKNRRDRRVRGCGIYQQLPKGVYPVSFPQPHGASPGRKDPRKKANPILLVPHWLAYWKVPFPLLTEPQGRLSSLFHRFSLIARDPHSRQTCSCCLYCSLGSPTKRVFAGHVIYMVERTSHLLTREGRGGWGGGWGGTVRTVCWASHLDLGDQGPPAGWGHLPWGVAWAIPGQGCAQKQHVPLEASAAMVIASSLRGWAGLGSGGRILAVAVARCDLWIQLLSLVSEEALPNKMSLSWDMLLSCDLVLMRNWVLRNITLSCSCLSSR